LWQSSQIALFVQPSLARFADELERRLSLFSSSHDLERHILSPLLTQNRDYMSKQFVNLQFKVIPRGTLARTAGTDPFLIAYFRQLSAHLPTPKTA
jgi:hypothetical protein